MFQRIIVPVDGSRRSWEAALVGALVAEDCDADLEVVTVVAAVEDLSPAVDELRRRIDEHAPWRVVPASEAVVADGHSVGATLARHAEEIGGTMIVMSSSGHGRSAAVLGSVADDVLRAMFGPIVVVGPNAKVPDSWTGDIVVPVDGSEFSELALPLAAAWGIAWGATPWVVEVLEDSVPAGVDVAESSYAHRLARALARQSHHDVEYEVLHGRSPAHAIADFAALNDARLIMMSTHGRTGFDRLTAGSVAAAVVHEASCPVVLQRPPRFAAS